MRTVTCTCHLCYCCFWHRAQAGKTDELAASHKGVNLQADMGVRVCVRAPNGLCVLQENMRNKRSKLSSFSRLVIRWGCQPLHTLAVFTYVYALHGLYICTSLHCTYIHTHTVCTCAAITVEFAHTSTHSPSAMPLQALADFESMEKAFSDLHTRYFKLKELTQALKKVGGLMCCPQRLLLIL